MMSIFSINGESGNRSIQFVWSFSKLKMAKDEYETLTESQFLELFIRPVNIVLVCPYTPSVLRHFDQKTRGVYNKGIYSIALA